MTKPMKTLELDYQMILVLIMGVMFSCNLHQPTFQLAKLEDGCGWLVAFWFGPKRGMFLHCANVCSLFQLLIGISLVLMQYCCFEGRWCGSFSQLPLQRWRTAHFWSHSYLCPWSIGSLLWWVLKSANCVVFLGKSSYSHSASVLESGKFYSGGNPQCSGLATNLGGWCCCRNIPSFFMI